MSRATFIAGDWGTSRLRLFLCDASGQLLAECEGPGAANLDEAFGAVLERLAEGWEKDPGKLPAILCGMVGSSIGWREVPYLACPARPNNFAHGAIRLTYDGRHVALLPGLKCRNRLGMPDVMRGEETQIAGALQLAPHLQAGRHVLCMPGTHTKWVLLDDGAVSQFQTALSGELYELLRRHSVLVGGTEEQKSGPGFALGMETVRACPDADMTHHLFSTRSRQLVGELERADAVAYLSGLVIGHDIAGARRAFGDEMTESGEVMVIGAPALAALYLQALAGFGLAGKAMAGNAASLAGLKQDYDELFGSEPHVA